MMSSVVTKNIRYWCTDIPSVYFCISIFTHRLWITSRVRQGLKVLPLPFILTLWFAYITSNLQTSNMNHKITNSDSDSWPQVVALDVDLPVKQAFHILHEQVAIFFSLRWNESFQSPLSIFSNFCQTNWCHFKCAFTLVNKWEWTRAFELLYGIWPVILTMILSLFLNPYSFICISFLSFSVNCWLEICICNFSDLDNLQGVFMAPLWDFCKGQFVGVLSASDFILILRGIYFIF